MCNNDRRATLTNRFRKLWQQHVYWTRFFIISTAADLADLEPVTQRLMRNPKDFAAALTPFFGAEAAACFQNLLTQHLAIAGELVNAAKRGDALQVAREREKWYANADEIAGFLACVNPHWNAPCWKKLLYSHLRMTEEEAVLRLEGRYPEDIAAFEQIEGEALKMADVMSCGILRL